MFGTSLSFRQQALALGTFIVASGQIAPPPVDFGPRHDCPTARFETSDFEKASTVEVRAPRGKLALVPVTSRAAQLLGLGCVERIAHGHGMLLMMPRPDQVWVLWMKDTIVSLDMVFVASNGVVTGVAADVPATRDGARETSIARRKGTGSYVMELRAGDAARYGLRSGVVLALPTIGTS
jgi:uncharacterized membrane protein (UPF0127 family)